MRILVVKLSSLGDILHVLPTVHELRVQLNAEIDWVVHPEFASLVHCFADVDNVLTFPRRGILKALGPSVKALKAKEYDLIVDLHGLFKSGFVAHLARGKRRIAPSYVREGAGIFFGERASSPDSNKCTAHDNRHAVERAYDTLSYLGLKRPEKPYKAELRESADLPVGEMPNNNNGKTIAFAPVSRWQSKDWPVERFGELAKLLLERDSSLRLMIVGGKGDIAVGDKIAELAGDSVRSRIDNICGKTSIAQSLQLLGKCDLLIANDTGPVHMAAAVGTRCLVIFGPTRPDWTGPYGEGHRVIMRKLPCQPCLKHKCPRGDHACMKSITAAEVADAAMEMIQ